MTRGTEMSIYQKASYFSGLEVSHLAFRTKMPVTYLVAWLKFEAVYSANVEKTWNGKIQAVGRRI